MNSALLILAVCRTPVTYELSKMTLLSVGSHGSVGGAPARCSGGRGFDSCQFCLLPIFGEQKIGNIFVSSKMFSPKFHWLTCTGHKIYRQQKVSQVNCSFEGLTLRRFFSMLHVLDSPLSNNAWFSAPYWTSSFRSACLRLCCCFHHLQSKTSDGLAEAISSNCCH